MIAGIRRSAGVAGLAMILAAASALAGPVADKAGEAESLVASGDVAGAIAAFDAATDAFWNASPLQFRVALFADSIAGFGKYAPRANSQFHSGETVNVYLEPVGYAFGVDGGTFKVSYGTGIEIRTPGGLILGKTDDFGKLDWQGRTKSYEVHAAVSVGLPDLKPGDYQLLLTVKDNASGKSAMTTLPFAIVP